MVTDPYVYPGTQVLRNKRGLLSQAQLATYEQALSSLAMIELEDQGGLPGAFDLAHLQTHHRFIFGDIYSWAGELRTVRIAKPGTMFCYPENIESYGNDVFKRLRGDDLLQNRTEEDFAAGLADLWGDLNSLHPFREGNGRSTRSFLSQLARQADHSLSWTGLDRGSNEQASIAAHRGDLGPMLDLVHRCLIAYRNGHPPSSGRAPTPRAPSGDD